jgi:hypothetical protein
VKRFKSNQPYIRLSVSPLDSVKHVVLCRIYSIIHSYLYTYTYIRDKGERYIVLHPTCPPEVRHGR